MGVIKLTVLNWRMTWTVWVAQHHHRVLEEEGGRVRVKEGGASGEAEAKQEV